MSRILVAEDAHARLASSPGAARFDIKRRELRLITPCHVEKPTRTKGKGAAPPWKRLRTMLSREMPREGALAILALPLTLYLLLGLGLLYVVYQMERFSRQIASSHQFSEAIEKARTEWHRWGLPLGALRFLWAPLSMQDPALATKWHASGITMVVFFPVTVPLLATCAVLLIAVNTVALLLNRLFTCSDNVLKLIRTGYESNGARPRRKRRPQLTKDVGNGRMGAVTSLERPSVPSRAHALTGEENITGDNQDAFLMQAGQNVTGRNLSRRHE